MSGIEVTGIVLGSVPLLISGLEHYAEGLNTIQRWLRYRRELKKLVRALRAEIVRFELTCVRVLHGLVSQLTEQEMITLLAQPQSLLWKDRDLEHKLRERLQQAYISYIEYVVDMNHAIEELRADLGLGPDLQHPGSSDDSFQDKLRAVRFALSQRRLEDSMRRIREDNDMLANLTSQNIELEPLRRRGRRPATDHLNSIQKQAKKLYNVIEKCWQCQCSTVHRADLRLDSRLANDLNNMDQAEDTGLMNFAVVFSVENHGSLNPVWMSQETEIRVLHIADHVGYQDIPTVSNAKNLQPDSSAQSPKARSQSSLTSALRKGISPRRKSKSVGFLPDTSGTPNCKGAKAVFIDASSPSTIDDESNKSSLSQADLSKLDEIGNLCQAMQQSVGNAQRHKRCLGYVRHDEKQALTIRCTNVDEARSNGRATKSFKEILAPYTPSHKMQVKLGDLSWSRAKRLDTALIVASSTLQLQRTPWLQDDWTKEDLFFSIDDVNKIEQFIYVSKIFPLGTPTVSANQSIFSDLPYNESIFNLGIFLIEMCLGRSFEVLHGSQHPSNTGGIEAILATWRTANRLLDQVYGEAGQRYGDAVRRCINCEFDQRARSLENDEFKQAVYNGVVIPLEAVVRDFNAR